MAFQADKSAPSGEGAAERAADPDRLTAAEIRHHLDDLRDRIAALSSEDGAQDVSVRLDLLMHLAEATVCAQVAAGRPDPSPAEAALREEVERLRDDRHELTEALTGLTCGGSEFFVRKGEDHVADIPACLEWIRRAKHGAIRGRIDAIRAQKTAESRATAAEREKAAALGLVEGQAAVIRRLERELGEARGVLRRVEWSVEQAENDGDGAYLAYGCPWCGETQADGHAPGCSLAAQLAPRPGTGEAQSESFRAERPLSESPISAETAAQRDGGRDG